jgi:single-stranded DNA-binding protein
MALLSSQIEDIKMQVFGNVATLPVRKESKSTGKGYYEFRLAEAQRGIDTSPTFYTVRVMKDDDPLLDKGDFVKVTGKLKADFYVGRDGKPTGTLLIIAFETSKIAKPAALKGPPPSQEREKQQQRPQAPSYPAERQSSQSTETVRIPVEQEEPDWSSMYG